MLATLAEPRGRQRDQGKGCAHQPRGHQPQTDRDRRDQDQRTQRRVDHEVHNTIGHYDEVVEVYRTSGETDYLLKVVVPDMVAFDEFYLRLVEQIDLYDVRSTFVMEQMKHTTALPLHYA